MPEVNVRQVTQSLQQAVAKQGAVTEAARAAASEVTAQRQAEQEARDRQQAGPLAEGPAQPQDQRRT